MNTKFYRNEWIVEHKAALYMPMIETADIVAKRYNVTAQTQDEYALMSQQRTAAGQKAGRFDDEIVPLTTIMAVENKETKEITKQHRSRWSSDEGNRPETTLEGLAKLKPVRGDDQFITAGNASQLSDGASACVLMSRQGSGQAQDQAAGHLPRLRGRRLRARRDGHRPGLRRAAPAPARRPQDGRHRPVGAERGVRRRR